MTVVVGGSPPSAHPPLVHHSLGLNLMRSRFECTNHAYHHPPTRDGVRGGERVWIGCGAHRVDGSDEQMAIGYDALVHR
jgi:hypothetical protein